MFDSIQNIDNVAIPIVGICIIFALMVAAYLEPKKDYSRKIFIFMDVGMDGHLAKPIDPERMYESISTALKERTD